jgi:hypothetical protein
LIVDVDGSVWVAQYVPSAAISSTPREWFVFDSAGEWLGTIPLPPNFDLYEVGSDYLLGRSRDEAGVETIQVLDLVRPR